jgi:GNAT superfamily N-acetyltransferase
MTGATEVTPERHEPARQTVSFADSDRDDLVLTTGAKSDWPYFARWHYMGSSHGPLIRAFVLWHEHDRAGTDGATPVGIVTFGPTSLDDPQRREVFGDQRFSPSVVNKWFSACQRVVLDPRYRGAGLAAQMLRTACRTHADLDAVKYIEAKTSMGAINRFNQAAGFDLIGTSNQMDQPIGGMAEGTLTGSMNEAQARGDRIRRIYKFMMDTEDEFGISVR